MADKKAMRISGAHMNHGFMQKLKARHQDEEYRHAEGLQHGHDNGWHLGQLAVNNPAKDGLTPAALALAHAPGQADKLPGDYPRTLGQTFANEIIRRMGEVTDENGETRDTSDLRDQLGSAMDWLRQRFGDETAAAAAGMIVQATASGVTEETLGTGLLNVLKFIDRNFGTAAGDAAISQFNSTVNQALNDFFDNGLNEIFYAAGDGEAAQDLTQRVLSTESEADASSSLDELNEILAQLKAELDNIAALQDLTAQLEEEFNPGQNAMEKAIAAYQAMPASSEAQLTSVLV